MTFCALGRVLTVQLKWMLQTCCEFAPDYVGLLRRLRDPAQIRAVERIMQFPYVLPVADERSEEELARIAERKREQGKKLQEMAAKARLEKVCALPLRPSCRVTDVGMCTARDEGKRSALPHRAA